jgi:hypothetical protein
LPDLIEENKQDLNKISDFGSPRGFSINNSGVLIDQPIKDAQTVVVIEDPDTVSEKKPEGKMIDASFKFGMS